MIITPTFIILFAIVFALVWWFATTIDKRKWVSLLIAVVAAPIVYFYVFYPLINIFSSYHHKKHFNADVWKETPALRYEMSDAMIASKTFENKNKYEVEQLLGKSEWYSWDDSLKINTPNQWNYNLGFKPGAFNRNQECLEIVFKNDRVKTIKQYQLEKTFD